MVCLRCVVGQQYTLPMACSAPLTAAPLPARCPACLQLSPQVSTAPLPGPQPKVYPHSCSSMFRDTPTQMSLLQLQRLHIPHLPPAWLNPSLCIHSLLLLCPRCCSACLQLCLQISTPTSHAVNRMKTGTLGSLSPQCEAHKALSDNMPGPSPNHTPRLDQPQTCTAPYRCSSACTAVTSRSAQPPSQALSH
jgi:hypothetical protein